MGRCLPFFTLPPGKKFTWACIGCDAGKEINPESVLFKTTPWVLTFLPKTEIKKMNERVHGFVAVKALALQMLWMHFFPRWSSLQASDQPMASWQFF